MQAWAGLGYYARARNLHACAKAVVEAHGGRFPDTEALLRKLPGIGAYTAPAIAAIAFNRPAAAVDGNVERVIARVFRVEEPLPKAKPRSRRSTERSFRRSGRATSPRPSWISARRSARRSAPPARSARGCGPAAPARRDCRRRSRARRRRAEGRAPRGGVRGAARRRSGAAAHPPARGLARRHGRAADQRLGAGLRPRARDARCAPRRPLDAPARRRPAWLHAFSPGTDGVFYTPARRDARAGGHALDAARGARRGAGAEGR